MEPHPNRWTSLAGRILVLTRLSCLTMNLNHLHSLIVILGKPADNLAGVLVEISIQVSVRLRGRQRSTLFINSREPGFCAAIIMLRLLASYWRLGHLRASNGVEHRRWEGNAILVRATCSIPEACREIHEYNRDQEDAGMSLCWTNCRKARTREKESSLWRKEQARTSYRSYLFLGNHCFHTMSPGHINVILNAGVLQS